MDDSRPDNSSLSDSFLSILSMTFDDFFFCNTALEIFVAGANNRSTIVLLRPEVCRVERIVLSGLYGCCTSVRSGDDLFLCGVWSFALDGRNKLVALVYTSSHEQSHGLLSFPSRFHRPLCSESISISI